MEITVQNYRQLRNSFDTTKLNAAVLEVFNDVDADFEDYLELYTDASTENDGIRDVVNNHIKLVNKYFVDQPKVDTEKKSNFKIGESVYLTKEIFNYKVGEELEVRFIEEDEQKLKVNCCSSDYVKRLFYVPFDAVSLKKPTSNLQKAVEKDFGKSDNIVFVVPKNKPVNPQGYALYKVGQEFKGKNETIKVLKVHKPGTKYAQKDQYHYDIDSSDFGEDNISEGALSALISEIKNKPVVIKLPAKKETIEDAVLNAKHTRTIIPKMQLMAVMQSGKGEEKQFFIDKIKEFESIFEAAQKRQDKKAMDSIVRAHFFYGQTHWYIFDYDPKENEFFGYVVLNGDTQMAESGYISINELHTIKGIELDFYWDQKELGKALHSEYPDEYDEYKPKSDTPAPKSQSKDIYLVKDGKVLTNHGMKTFWFTDNPQFGHRIEDIDFANRMKAHYDAQIVFGFDLMKSEIENYVAPKTLAKTKTPPKAKIKPVIDKKFVDNFSTEFQLIRRFWNVIKDKNIEIPFRKTQLLFMAFNKAAIERKVRKTSEVADIFNQCNEKMRILFEEFAKPTQAPIKVTEFADQKLFKEIEDYVTDVAINPAVSVLKRFIAIQNTTPDVKKAEAIKKSLEKVLENDSNNRLSNELKDAIKWINDYIKKPSTPVETEVYGLSVPGICTNRIKCTGIDKTGKLHKGYKFQEHTGNIVKVRAASTKRKIAKKPAKKKPTSKKKVSVGLGFSDEVEKIYVDNPIIPITNPEPENWNKPAIEQPAPKEQISQPAMEQPVVKNKLMNMQFESLPMDEGWENFMQNPAKNLKMAIWGAPKNGKTAGSLQLANYLTKFGKVLYNFADQGFNKSTQDLWQMSGLANNAKAEPSDVQTLADLEKEIATGKYTFVFIDMISDYINKEGIKPYEFKERFMKKYPKVSFVLIFEVTKGGNFKGDQGWTHVVDAIVTVEDFLMENRGRYGVGSHIVWEDGLKRFNPKRYQEVMDELNPDQLEFEEVERI